MDIERSHQPRALPHQKPSLPTPASRPYHSPRPPGMYLCLPCHLAAHSLSQWLLDLMPMASAASSLLYQRPPPPMTPDRDPALAPVSRPEGRANPACSLPRSLPYVLGLTSGPFIVPGPSGARSIVLRVPPHLALSDVWIHSCVL